MIFKNLFVCFLVVLFLSSCSYNYFNYDTKKDLISFPLSKDKSMIVKLDNSKFEYRFSQCSFNSYTLKDKSEKYGELFLENIELESSCQWNGLASGYFIYELRNQMKFKDFKFIERFKKDNYEISTYKIDNSSYINIIELYTTSTNLFIVDNKGVLSAELIRNLDSKYMFKYDELKRVNIDYNYSLVDNNFYKSYFSFEKMLADEKK